MPRLPRSFYRRDPVTLARDLLGQRLVRILDGQRLAGTIVETEAYLGVEDKAAHTVGGRRTPRVESMWQDGGTAYVYFTYGMHHCFNVVASVAGDPVAALIRAIEPTEGLDAMRPRRPAAKQDRDLCSGPAKLCQALAIDRGRNGADLVTGPDLYIEKARVAPPGPDQVVAAPRVGVDYAGDWAGRPLRFYLRASRYVSRR